MWWLPRRFMEMKFKISFKKFFCFSTCRSLTPECAIHPTHHAVPSMNCEEYPFASVEIPYDHIPKRTQNMMIPYTENHSHGNALNQFFGVHSQVPDIPIDGVLMINKIKIFIFPFAFCPGLHIFSSKLSKILWSKNWCKWKRKMILRQIFYMEIKK